MDFNLPQLLVEEDSFGVFLLVTIALGGGAAYMSGRAIAATWRPWWHVTFYMLILASAVRFMHFALFEGTLLSPHYYLVDLTFCLLFGFLGYRITRAGQMSTQYRWLYRRTGALKWRPRDPAET
jgi:hypothetical protein